MYWRVKRHPMAVCRGNGKWCHRTLTSWKSARWLECPISEIVGTFDISRSLVSRVYHEYLIESITALCGRSGRHEIKEFSLTFDGEAIVTHLQDVLNVQPSNHLSVLWLPGNMRVETYQGVPVNTTAPDKASPPEILTSLIEPRLTGSKWHTKKELTWENYMKQDIIQDWQRNVHNPTTWITRRVLIKIHGE